MSSVTRSAPALSLKNSRVARAAVAAAAIAVMVSPALPMQAVTAAAAPGDTITVTFPYLPSGVQTEWTVPAGVSEVTVELAAGSGASVTPATGGPGGAITARVPVTPGQTLLVLIGPQGVTTPLMTGGEGSAVATADGDLLVVAGGGGASFRCAASGVTNEVCGSGGAGGFSAQSGSAPGEVASPPPQSAATTSGPGVSGDVVVNGVPTGPIGYNQPSPNPAAVVAGVVTTAPPTDPSSASEPVEGLSAGGGGGYYAGGQGKSQYNASLDPTLEAVNGGGGGGGSGFLIASATQLSLANNVGNGFASISYVEPAASEPDSELAATGTAIELGVAGLAALALVVLGAIVVWRGRRADTVS
ncbi:glycine-rich protein [Microcella sp.]|uniref:glycine-rich domain-containing protein n=1 Tax=Microcella sp. TaxID=1913979 RepID=UPI002565C9B2|nr:glycine-rich protein [Microcella sp.]MBX9471080.1 hypothetical protein [Microcella sp.]